MQMPREGGLQDQPARWVYWAGFYRQEVSRFEAELQKRNSRGGGNSPPGVTTQEVQLFHPNGGSLLPIE